MGKVILNKRIYNSEDFIFSDQIIQSNPPEIAG